MDRIHGFAPYDKSVSPEFRQLQRSDLEPVLAMMAHLYAERSGAFDADRARRATLLLLTEPDFGGVWTIHMDGVLAGYLAVVLGYSLEFGGQFGLLDELFVDSAWRGHGLGSAAIAFAAERCRELGWQALRLEVEQDNERALALYRRSGFDLHDRFLMTKWI